MYSELTNTFEQLHYQNISEERKMTLQPLIDFVQQKMDEGKDININFICTLTRAEAIYHKSGHKQELLISIF